MGLQDAAKSGVQHATQNNLSGLQHVAQLLSGHQTVAAAVLAVSMGDVRLASLLAQVSHLQCPTCGGMQLHEYCIMWADDTLHELY